MAKIRKNNMEKEIKCSSCGKTEHKEAIEFDDGQNFCRECCEKVGVPIEQQEPIHWKEDVKNLSDNLINYFLSIGAKVSKNDYNYVESGIGNLICQTREEVLDEVKKGLPKTREIPEVQIGKDKYDLGTRHGRNDYRQDILTLINKLK